MSTSETYAIASICGELGALHVYKPRDNAPRQSRTGCHVKTSNSCCLLSRNQLLCLTQTSTTASTSICTYDLNRVSGGCTLRCTAPEEKLCCISCSPCGGYIVAGGSSGRCYIWCSSTGQLLNTWSAHLQTVTVIAFTDDSLGVLSGGADGAVHLFALHELVDVCGGDERKAATAKVSLRGHTLPVSVLAVGYGGSGSRIVTGGHDRSVKVWHLHSGRCVGTIRLTSRATAGVIGPDESFAYIGCADGRVIVIELMGLTQGTAVSCNDMAGIEAPVDGDEEVSVMGMSLSPEGKELVVGYSDGIVRIFDAYSRTMVSVYGKHSTTAGIEIVMTLAEMPRLDVETRDEGINEGSDWISHEGVVFGKVRDEEIEEKLVGKVDMCIGKSVHESCHNALERATEMCFGEMEKMIREKKASRESDTVMNDKENGEGTIPKELLAEMERLRERNRKLEEAGGRLIELVEKELET